MGISLSELYATAISNYVAAHRKSAITELLNQVYATEPTTLEAELSRLQFSSLGDETW